MSFLYVRPRFLLFYFVLFTSHIAIAQARYNIFAGIQAGTTAYSIKGSKQETTIKPGFLAGAGAKIEFENRLYFSPAVFYSFKGYNVKLNQAAFPPNLQAVENKTSVHSLEIAPLLQYDFTGGPAHFYFKAGPILDIQLMGKEKTTLMDGNVVKGNMPYGFTAYGRYAASATFQFGYEFSNDFFAQGFYSYGLTDLNNADDGPAINYRFFGIVAGKYFGKKKR